MHGLVRKVFLKNDVRAFLSYLEPAPSTKRVKFSEFPPKTGSDLSNKKGGVGEIGGIF